MVLLLLIRNFLLKSLAGLFLLMLLAGCAVKDSPSLLKLHQLPDDGRICRAAVLPFANQTDYPQGGAIVGKMFASELAEVGGVVLAPEGDIRKVLMQMQIVPGGVPPIELVRALADRLDAQVVITGTVVEMGDKLLGSQELNPSLAVIVRILESDSGRTMWTTYNRREGQDYGVIMHFGVINSVTELAKITSNEIVLKWFEEGMQKCVN